MVRLATAPVQFTVAPYFDCLAFLADLHWSGFAAGAHAWVCRRVADELQARMRRPVLQGYYGGTRHKRRCTSCERALPKFENRSCQLCSDYQRLFGIAPDDTGSEYQFTASELSRGDGEAFDGAQVEASDVDLADELARGELLINPLRWRICQVYVAEKGNVSAVARIVNRDRHTVRHHLERYRDQLDRIIREGGSLETAAYSPSMPTLQSSMAVTWRAELYAFSSEKDGNGQHKRIPQPVDHFDIKCTSCGVKRQRCVGKCCADCWHPDPIHLRETRFNTSRG